ncbi:hypothetical protein [Serratia fonticola]
MTDKFELDKKFQALPEHAQVRAAEALRNALSQGVDADAQSSEQIGRNIKKAFIALFESESGAVKSGIHIGDGCAYPGTNPELLSRVAAKLEENKTSIIAAREGNVAG